MSDADTRWLSDREQESWRAFISAVLMFLDRLDDDLRENHDISHTDFTVLVRLSEADGARLRMTQLATGLRLAPSRVTQTVARLESRGLVSRGMTPGDRRGVDAILTAKGQRVLDAASRTHVAGVRRHLVDLTTPAEFDALGKLSTDMLQSMTDSSTASTDSPKH